MAQPEKIMPEGSSSPEIAQAAQASTEAVTNPTQPGVLRQRFHPLPGFDFQRAGAYTKEMKGPQTIFRDPVTGQEVARIVPDIGGGDQTNNPKDQKTSPIPGMTAEEVELFTAHGISIDDIKSFQDRQDFRQQVDRKLEEWRSEQKPLTPEEKAQKEKEEKKEKEKRGKELEEAKKRIKDMPENTDKERRLKLFRRIAIDEELKSLSDGGSSDGGERRGGVEGPPNPPDKTLEYESSPERGRQIIKEIVRLEGLHAAGKKLTEVQWEELDDLYLQQEIHIDAVRIISLRAKPTERKETKSKISEIRAVNPEALNGLRSVNDWMIDFEEGAISTDDDWSKFNQEVDVYFKEAKDTGLLKDLDRALSKSWREAKIGMGRGQDASEIMQAAEQRIHLALNNLVNLYVGKQRTDRNLSRLAVINPQTNRVVRDPQTGRIRGIWDLYVDLARARFIDAITRNDSEGITQGNYCENEFHLGQTEEDDHTTKETFWRLQNGWYIDVYAQTEEEFEIAADSYISRLQAITSDAKKVTQEASQFIDVLAKSEGAKKLLETNPKFINELILGIEARVGVFGADDANERYNGADYKAFLDFINKDGKGPDRWLTLPKMVNGRVAAALWKLDKDPRWEILFATYGSRGQLAKTSIAQKNRAGEGVFNHAYNMLIEEMLGVQIRNSDDADKLNQFMPDSTFITFFDGLYKYDPQRKSEDYGDINIKAWEAIKGKPERWLTLEERQSSKNGAARLGRIQAALRNGEKLSESDQRFYGHAWADAKKAVDIAFQMYGTLGEKSKRAGGVFKTSEKTDSQGKTYQYFVPIHWAEKYIQCAETLTKIQYAHLSAKDRTAKVKQARDRNIAIFKKDGFEAKMVDADGNPMKMKVPDEDSNARDANGNFLPKEIEVDFHTGTHHPYSDWSGDTYDSYQEERRALLLLPTTLANARLIIEGKLLPENADPVAVRRVIIDPTLKRLRRFEKGFEDRERKLTMAAVEESYQGHWRITRELYRAFWPKYGTPAEEIGIYYGLQDYGGYRKTLESMRARIAEDPERFARRGRRLLPDLHNPVATLSEYLGQGSNGALASIRLMGYPMYRLCGTFALDKFSANAEMGGKVSDALIGSYNTQAQEETYNEGLLLKPTNNSDKLRKIALGGLKRLPDGTFAWGSPGTQLDFCYALMESLGRLKRYENLLTTMESAVRNATGALWIEDVDIFTDGGELSKKVENELNALPAISYISVYSSNGEGVVVGKELTRDDLASLVTGTDKVMSSSEGEANQKFNKAEIDEAKSPKTGSGRTSITIFHNTFGDFLVDEEAREGGLPTRAVPEMYSGEKHIYKHIKDKMYYPVADEKDPSIIKSLPSSETVWQFVGSKFYPT